MANYYTHFSCLLDVGTPDNAAVALELYNDFCARNAAEDPPSDGFLFSIELEHRGSTLWLRDDGSGDPEAVIRFVRACAKAFGLTRRWGFQYALSCSRPRMGAFGGGAHVLDLATGETVDWIFSGSWLKIILSGGDPYA